MTRQRIANFFLLAACFLLPWQTIWLYRIVALPEGATVYGNLGVYATEFLIAIAFLLRGRPIISIAFQKIMQASYFFLAAGFLALSLSSIFSVSLGLVSHLVVAGMFFFLLLDERTNIRFVIHAFIAGLILPCLLGWFQYLYGWSPASTILGLSEKYVETSGIAVVATDAFRSLRAYGSFPHPNIFGGYLAMSILMIGWMVCGEKEGKKERRREEKSWKFIPLIVLFTSTLMLTFSRGAWLAVSVSLFAVIAQALWYKKLIPHRAIPVMTVGILTILLTIGILHTHVFARFNPALHVEAISIEERSSQYQTFPSVFLISPIVGVGPGAYVFALETLSKNQPSWSYQPIHNTFLLLLAELGIIGFVAFGYFLFEIFHSVPPLLHKEGIRGWSRLNPVSSGKIFATAFCLGLAILALFDHYLFSMWPGLALATIVLAISIRFANE